MIFTNHFQRQLSYFIQKLNHMDELQAFQEDLEVLVNTLKEAFEADNIRYTIEAETETLYVEIAGLEDFSEDEIVETAGEILEELYLDFEEIILLPYSDN